MFSVLEAAAAAQPAAPAPVAGAEKPADAKAGSGAGAGSGMGGMASMLGGGKAGFTGGTKKDKQMNSIMNFFTNTMNEMFGGMAPKKK